MKVSGIFGLHDVPLRIVHEGISFSIEKDGGGLLYKRKCMDEEVENIFLSSNSKVLINPIEPLNMPKELTPYLLIEFEKSIFIEPMTNKNIFITFPVKIGIFVHGKKDYQIIDIITLAKQKFTLHGSVKSGIICKYWKSDVYSTMPDEAIEIIKDLIEEHPLALKNPPPMVFVDNLGDNAVNIIVRIWAPPTEWFDVKMEMLWKIKKGLEENGIEIAFPQRTVWFANELHKQEVS